MVKFRRFMTRALLAGFIAFLIVPFLIPEPNSGTLTNVEAAGSNATFVKVNDLDVHVKVEPYQGNCQCKAPLILLMHGFGASTFSWRNVIQPLSQYGEVVAYDRPGFGFTERPDTWQGVNPYGFEGNFELIDGLIAKFGQGRKVVLVGHSAGGQLAAEYARLNQTKVDGLVLVDAAIFTTGGGPDGFDWVYQIPQIKRLGPVLVSSIAQTGDDLLRRSFYDQDNVTDEVLSGYHSPLKVKGWEKAFWNFATAPRGNKLVENLADIKTPTIIITGVSDTVVPATDAPKLSEALTNSTLEVVQRATHLPQEEQPARFMAAIRSAWPKVFATINH